MDNLVSVTDFSVGAAPVRRAGGYIEVFPVGEGSTTALVIGGPGELERAVAGAVAVAEEVFVEAIDLGLNVFRVAPVLRVVDLEVTRVAVIFKEVVATGERNACQKNGT